jgi:hypothetical protein
VAPTPIAVPPPSPAPSLPPPAPALRAEGRAEIALLGAGSDGAWGWFVVHPDPAPLVLACYREALAVDPGLFGHAVYLIEGLPDRGDERVRLVESTPLPPTLHACIIHALRRLEGDDGFAGAFPPSHAYISLW